jgi:hypothetical protein
MQQRHRRSVSQRHAEEQARDDSIRSGHRGSVSDWTGEAMGGAEGDMKVQWTAAHV